MSDSQPRLVFRDPPRRHIETEVPVLRSLMEHPNQWALVAECVVQTERNRWNDARRKVGAQGEFVIRQAKAHDLGLVDIYVKYVPEVTS